MARKEAKTHKFQEPQKIILKTRNSLVHWCWHDVMDLADWNKTTDFYDGFIPVLNCHIIDFFHVYPTKRLSPESSSSSHHLPLYIGGGGKAIKAESVIGARFLLETYLDGDEVDVDVIMSDGEWQFAAVSDNGPTFLGA